LFLNLDGEWILGLNMLVILLLHFHKPITTTSKTKKKVQDKQTNKKNVQENQTRKRASHSSCKPSKHNTLHTQANCNLESDQNANKRQNNSRNSIKQLPIIFARSLEFFFWNCEFLVSDAHTKLLRTKKQSTKKQSRKSAFEILLRGAPLVAQRLRDLACAACRARVGHFFSV
jgi:hypothetical protein